MTISELETPALLVDLDRLESNLKRVAGYASKHSLGLRPHTKTHKTPELGRMQLDSGARGLTVAKVGEAEVMVDSGTPELLVAYPVLGESKLKRLIEVAGKTRVIVALDSVEAAEGLSAAALRAGVRIDVLVEADVGMRRGGRPPGPALIGLAEQVDRLQGVRLEGVAFYPGHLWPPDDDFEAQLGEVAAQVERICEDFRRAGLPLNIVSGGSTPTLFDSHKMPGMTEIRPGTAIFNDRTEVASGCCGWQDCAATILTTVISTPRENFALIDGGSKTFTSDPAPGCEENTFGRVVEAPEARFFKINEEHGYLDLSALDGGLRIGDRLRVVPNHICVAVNLHEKIYGVRGERVEQVWSVRGRGKLQ